MKPNGSNNFFKTRASSFRYAFNGLWFVIRTQQNAWIHAVISIFAVITGFLLRLNSGDWAFIIFAIVLVWTSELFNTALEALVDLASPEHHQLARVCKDVGAAAVLISAIGAVLIGCLIFGPPLWERLQLWFHLQ